MSESSFSSSTAVDWTFVCDAFGDDPDDGPPTLGVREPRRPLLPTLDGAVALEEPAE